MTHAICSPDGTPISRFAFGTMQWGDGADQAAAQAMFGACRDAGITHFDTAHVYTEGRSEQILGQLAKDARDSLIIATKAGYVGGSTRANILKTFDESRARLGMDHVDILYMHRWDDKTPPEETFETLATLQQAGKIRYIGVSNYAAWQVMKSQSVAASFGTRIDIIQPMYNLVKRQAEVELLPMCASEGIACAPYSPLGGGLLSGKYAAPDADGRLKSDDRYAARYAPDFMHDAARMLSEIAAEIGAHPATLAAAWAAHHTSGPMPILSARRADQLAPSLAAISYAMTPDLYARLTALAPTPPPATDRLDEA